MGLTRERDGRFFLYYTHTTEVVFATIATIISLIIIFGKGRDFMVDGFAMLIVIGLAILFVVIASLIGSIFDNNFTADDKKYAFRQGKTSTFRVASENEIKRADAEKRALFLCYDYSKNKYYWYIKEQFYSTKKELTKEQFMVEYIAKKNKMSTHVYLIKQEDSRMYKIGVTNNVKRRFSSIQTSNPNKLSLVYSGKVNDAKKLEKKMHVHFKKQKVRLEWFRLDSPDVKYVIRKIDEEAYTEFEVKSISSESQARVDNYNRKRRMKTTAPLLPADKIDMLASKLAEDLNKE